MRHWVYPAGEMTQSAKHLPHKTTREPGTCGKREPTPTSTSMLWHTHHIRAHIYTRYAVFKKNQKSPSEHWREASTVRTHTSQRVGGLVEHECPKRRKSPGIMTTHVISAHVRSSQEEAAWATQMKLWSASWIQSQKTESTDFSTYARAHTLTH